MPHKKIIRACDVMHGHFCLVDGLVTVDAALALMNRDNAQTLIIDKRNADDEYGLVLPSDIAKKVLAPDLSPKRVSLYEIMSKPVLSVHPHMQVRYCARLMDQFGLSIMPVVDQSGKVLGLVDYNNLVIHGQAAEVD